jgi:hypothetical protein
MSAPAKWRIGDGKLRQSVVRLGDGGLYVPKDFLIAEGPTERRLGPEFLGHLDIPGRIRLLPWDPLGPRVEAAYAAVVSQRTLGERSLDDYGPEVALVDLFQHLRLGSDGRIGLSAEARFHLGVKLGEEVQLWRYPGGLELWTREYRTSRLLALPPEVAELPWGED